MKLATFARLVCLVTAFSLPVAAQIADSNKTLRYYFRGPEKGFDPAKYSDHYSNVIQANIFESLLDYDYLARPMKLRPKAAESLPQIADDGKLYTFKIKKGIYFADDPAFGGKKRELIAQDFVYSIQRMVDSNNNGAPWDFMFKGKVIGLDEKIAAAQKTGKFDYDKPIEGLKALDKYTLQIKLSHSDFNIPYIMAAPCNGAVAREVVEKYGEEIAAHPVGTGPYRLRSWQRRNRIVLEANPTFRGETYQSVEGATGVDPAALAELNGRLLPQVGVIDIRIIETPQSAWLAYEDGGLDIMAELGVNYATIVAPGNKLADKYAKLGWQYYRNTTLSTQSKEFNMADPVVGGLEPEKVALRRAFAMAFNSAFNVWVIKNGQAEMAHSPLPPGIVGYDPNFKNSLEIYSPARGNATLDTFGYKDCDGDGWREAPGCKPLTITYLTSIGTDSRDDEELVEKSWAKLKIKCLIKKVQFPDLVSARQNGSYQMAVFVWGADYPDAENFMQLFYGPNAGPVNETRFKNAEFDKLYERMASMADSPERNAIIRRMNNIIAAYAPWVYEFHAVYPFLAHPWVSGYRPFPDAFPRFMFMDIDLKKRAAVLGDRAN